MSKFTEVLKKAGLLEDEEGSAISEESLERIRRQTQDMLSGEGDALGAPLYPEDSGTDAALELPETLPLEGLLTVEEIYKQFNISSLEASIYKVDDFTKALPDNLPTDVKKQSVIGILKATNLKLEVLIEDGKYRTDVLNRALTSFSEETDNIVNQGNKDIEDLQSKIDEIKQKVNDRKKLQESQDSLVKDEVSRINSILNFLE